MQTNFKGEGDLTEYASEGYMYVQLKIYQIITIYFISTGLIICIGSAYKESEVYGREVKCLFADLV
jgi:hypothetical protein